MLDPTTLLRTLHGWVGLLAAVLLLHPIFALWAAHAALPSPPALRRGLRWSSLLAAGVTFAAFASGWLLYPEYRAGTKRELLEQAPALASAFETKEHLSWYVLVLALGGVGLVWSGGRSARLCLALAALLAIATCVLGAVVGAFRVV